MWNPHSETAPLILALPVPASQGCCEQLWALLPAQQSGHFHPPQSPSCLPWQGLGQPRMGTIWRIPAEALCRLALDTLSNPRMLGAYSHRCFLPTGPLSPCLSLHTCLWWLRRERIHLQCGRPGFDPWVEKIPWSRERLLTPVFWPREFHGRYFFLK